MRPTLPVLVTALAVSLAACGGGGSGDKSASATFVLTPAAGTALPDAEANVAYSQTITVTGGGGLAPYRFAQDGTVAGLAVAGSGDTTFTVAGTPTSEGLGTIRVEITDGRNRVAFASYTLRVKARAGTLSLTPTSLPVAKVAVNYSQFLTVTGGVAPFAWSQSGTLPAGVTFGSKSGAQTGQTNDVSGTPTTTGSFAVTVTVTDSSSPVRTGTATYTLAVN